MRMIPTDRMPTSPGEMLLEEFIKPLGLTQGALADKLGMSRVAVNEIVNGRRGVTPATALRLGKALGTTPEFWLNGQISVDLYKAEHDEELGFPSYRGDIALKGGRRWQSHGGSSIRISGRARSGLSGRPASRSRRWPGTWALTREPWVTG
jgi:addiction module HigA family antidote